MNWKTHQWGIFHATLGVVPPEQPRQQISPTTNRIMGTQPRQGGMDLWFCGFINHQPRTRVKLWSTRGSWEKNRQKDLDPHTKLEQAKFLDELIFLQRTNDLERCLGTREHPQRWDTPGVRTWFAMMYILYPVSHQGLEPRWHFHPSFLRCGNC